MIELSLRNIVEIILTKDILVNTFAFLQNYGKKQLESHALWVGQQHNTSFKITDVWFPAQKNTTISYEVSEDEEFRINLQLTRENKTIIAQVHTHPGEAFHSCTDNEGSALSLPGSLSIVIPDFGFIDPEHLDYWEVFRYNNDEWNYVLKKEVEQTFKII